MYEEAEHILLTGPITIYEAATVRESLRIALAVRKPLVIDLSDSGPWDIAGLQLLISCVRSGQQSSQVVRVVNPPRTCAELAQRSGLSDWLHSAGG
jgi:ABC-type transporter Mla MlaB component